MELVTTATTDSHGIRFEQLFVTSISPKTKVKRKKKKKNVGDVDIIARIVGTAREKEIVGSVKTADMIHVVDLYMENTLMMNEIFIKVMKYFKKTISYNGYYNSYLLGMINKEEFEDISNRFVIYHKNKLNSNNVDMLMNLLKDNSDIEFDIEEIADIFEIKESELIEYYEKKRIVYK